jgi:hypothetical protein
MKKSIYLIIGLTISLTISLNGQVINNQGSDKMEGINRHTETAIELLVRMKFIANNWILVELIVKSVLDRLLACVLVDRFLEYFAVAIPPATELFG